MNRSRHINTVGQPHLIGTDNFRLRGPVENPVGPAKRKTAQLVRRDRNGRKTGFTGRGVGTDDLESIGIHIDGSGFQSSPDIGKRHRHRRTIHLYGLNGRPAADRRDSIQFIQSDPGQPLPDPVFQRRMNLPLQTDINRSGHPGADVGEADGLLFTHPRPGFILGNSGVPQIGFQLDKIEREIRIAPLAPPGSNQRIDQRRVVGRLPGIISPRGLPLIPERTLNGEILDRR